MRRTATGGYFVSRCNAHRSGSPPTSVWGGCARRKIVARCRCDLGPRGHSPFAANQAMNEAVLGARPDAGNRKSGDYRARALMGGCTGKCKHRLIAFCHRLRIFPTVMLPADYHHRSCQVAKRIRPVELTDAVGKTISLSFLLTEASVLTLSTRSRSGKTSSPSDQLRLLNCRDRALRQFRSVPPGGAC
jgi:hypothetical protein